MGWDGVELRPGQTAESFIRSDIESNGNTVEEMHRGPEGEFYVALRLGRDVEDFKKGSVMGLVVLTERSGPHTMFKWMDETMGPCYYAVSRSLFRKLSPLPERSGYAAGWRQNVKTFSFPRV